MRHTLFGVAASAARAATASTRALSGAAATAVISPATTEPTATDPSKRSSRFVPFNAENAGGQGAGHTGASTVAAAISGTRRKPPPEVSYGDYCVQSSGNVPGLK